MTSSSRPSSPNGVMEPPRPGESIHGFEGAGDEGVDPEYGTRAWVDVALDSESKDEGAARTAEDVDAEGTGGGRNGEAPRKTEGEGGKGEGGKREGG